MVTIWSITFVVRKHSWRFQAPQVEFKLMADYFWMATKNKSLFANKDLEQAYF